MKHKLEIKPAKVKPNQILIMPPPAVLNDKAYTPFIHNSRAKDKTRFPILYATNRLPASEENKEPYYLSQRGNTVQLGIAGIEVAEGGKTWDDITHLEESSARNKKKVLLEVVDVEEYGILDHSPTVFTDRPKDDIKGQANELFLSELRSQMEQTDSKDVFVFVHGYNVNFENPLLMTVQLWHYLGCKGSFISYGWPATTQGTAYLKDLDTASMSARELRIFLDFLAEQEEINQIHILGYSAGTRLVTQALYQKALQMTNVPEKEALAKTKLGTVILASSDMDRGLFGSYLRDGQLNILKKMYLYSSSKDMILGASQAIHFAPRMGQTIKESEINQKDRDAIKSNDKLRLIDVSHADQIISNGGHFYFLESPWVSNDVLLTLLTGAEPQDRGLVPHNSLPFWTFPTDYIKRCKEILDQVIAPEKTNPPTS